MKRFLFIINRNIYYKFMAPLIDGLLKNGLHVVSAHLYFGERFQGNKAQAFPLLYSNPFSNVKNCSSIILRSFSELKTYIQTEQFDAIVSLETFHYYQFQESELGKSKWVVLQHWGDNFQSEKKNILNCHLFLIYSRQWWDNFLLTDYAKELEQCPFDQIPVLKEVGCPYHDVALNFSDREIRKKYGIPLDKKIVLYVPLGMMRPKELLRKLWFKFFFFKDNFFTRLIKKHATFLPKVWRTNEVDFVDAIHRFCKNNDAVLVLKARVKRPLPSYFKQYSDHILYDESFYPATVVELIKISDLVVTHFSSMFFEIALQGKYNINVELSVLGGNLRRSLKKIFGPGIFSDLEIPGVNKIISDCEFLKTFSTQTFGHYVFNNIEGQKFQKKYFKQTIGQSTDLAIQEITRIIK